MSKCEHKYKVFQSKQSVQKCAKVHKNVQKWKCGGVLGPLTPVTGGCKSEHKCVNVSTNIKCSKANRVYKSVLQFWASLLQQPLPYPVTGGCKYGHKCTKVCKCVQKCTSLSRVVQKCTMICKIVQKWKCGGVLGPLTPVTNGCKVSTNV